MKQQQRPQRQLQQCYTNNNTNNNLSAAHIVEPRHTCTSTHKLNKLFFSCYALNEIRSVAKNRRAREREREVMPTSLNDDIQNVFFSVEKQKKNEHPN